MKPWSLERVKDAALERALLVLLRPKFARYGEIRRLTLDTAGRRFSGELRLLGDPLPIEVADGRYRIDETNDPRGRFTLTFHDVKTSKEWLQNLIEDRFPEVTVPLPDYVRALL